ncbi:MAG: hypothetical protein AB1626_03140 [Candidatus Micrarchaeota archaeon]
MQFASFQASFPDCEYSLELREPITAEALAKLVSEAQAVCAHKMFDYAPLDRQKIAELAPRPKNEGQLFQELSALKPSSLEARLLEFITEKVPELKDESEAKKAETRKKGLAKIALQYYLKTVLDSALPKQLPPKNKASKKEVRLAVNTAEWKAVKKVATDGSAADKEIAAALAGIHDTLKRKQAELTPALSALAEKLGEPRKSMAALIAALPLAAQAPTEFKREAYETVMAACGYPPFIDVETVGGAWPELKIPKPRGNYGGKKKK